MKTKIAVGWLVLVLGRSVCLLGGDDPPLPTADILDDVSPGQPSKVGAFPRAMKRDTYVAPSQPLRFGLGIGGGVDTFFGRLFVAIPQDHNFYVPYIDLSFVEKQLALPNERLHSATLSYLLIKEFGIRNFLFPFLGGGLGWRRSEASGLLMSDKKLVQAGLVSALVGLRFKLAERFSMVFQSQYSYAVTDLPTARGSRETKPSPYEQNVSIHFLSMF